MTEAIRIHQDIPRRSVMEHALDVLRKVNIPAAESRVKDYPHQMSGGMRQRVVGAIGISCQPQVLIADEPTTSLDVTIQAQYLKLLKDLQRDSNLSVIFITHDFGIVAKMCDRVAVMYAGRMWSKVALEIYSTNRLILTPRPCWLRCPRWKRMWTGCTRLKDNRRRCMTFLWVVLSPIVANM